MRLATTTALLGLTLFALGCASVADNGGVDGGADQRDADGGANADATSVSDARVADAAVTVEAGCALAKEGESCVPQNKFCSTLPCNNPCEFCNVLSCISGTWQRLEAPPLPQDECADTFACGATTCNKGQYCVANHPGVKLADGGTPPPTYACLPLPVKCGGGCTCALDAAKIMSSCTPTTCSAPSGGPVVQCYGI